MLQSALHSIPTPPISMICSITSSHTHIHTPCETKQFASRSLPSTATFTSLLHHIVVDCFSNRAEKIHTITSMTNAPTTSSTQLNHPHTSHSSRMPSSRLKTALTCGRIIYLQQYSHKSSTSSSSVPPPSDITLRGM